MIAGINSVPSDSRIDSSIGIFVFLDQNEKINRKKIDSFYEPKMHELRELLREPYSRFTDNKSLFKVNAEKKQACIEIFQIFYTFWNKVITCWNEGYEQDEWNQILGNNHNISDIKYLESFTMTQMFTNHVQEDYF